LTELHREHFVACSHVVCSEHLYSLPRCFSVAVKHELAESLATTQRNGVIFVVSFHHNATLKNLALFGVYLHVIFAVVSKST